VLPLLGSNSGCGGAGFDNRLRMRGLSAADSALSGGYLSRYQAVIRVIKSVAQIRVGSATNGSEH
jgi:hypothetical protein